MSPKYLYFEIAQRMDGITAWGAALVSQPTSDALEDYRRALSRVAVFSPRDPLAPSNDGERLVQQGLSRAIAWAVGGGSQMGAKAGDRVEIIGPAYARGPIWVHAGLGAHFLEDLGKSADLDLVQGLPDPEISRYLYDGVIASLKSYRAPKRIQLDFDSPARALATLWDHNVLERRHVRSIVREALGADAMTWIDRRSDLDTAKVAEFFAKGGLRARSIVEKQARQCCLLTQVEVEIQSLSDVHLEEQAPSFTL